MEAKLLLEALDCGGRGGRGGGELEYELELESSLLLLSELLMATARAKELLLELMGLFDIPPPLFFRGKQKLRFFSHTRLCAKRFLRFLE